MWGKYNILTHTVHLIYDAVHTNYNLYSNIMIIIPSYTYDKLFLPNIAAILQYLAIYDNNNDEREISSVSRIVLSSLFMIQGQQ